MNKVFNIEQNIEYTLLKEIVHNIFEPVFCMEKDNLIYANKNILSITNEGQLEKYFKIFTKSNNNSKPPFFYLENRKKQFEVKNIYLENENIQIFILRDVSYKERYKKYLNNLLYTNSLTSLPNRKALIDRLQEKDCEINSIALIDINSFKEINEFFGHKVGDFILQEIALFLKNFTKQCDLIDLYKFPTDVYCITCTKNRREDFEQLIKNVVEFIYKKVFVYEQHEIDVRVTAGISFSQKKNKLITADIALKTAKQSHKDYLIFYEELDNIKEYENNMLWTKKLKSALINDRIEVYFQPLINNKTVQIEKYECLVRLIDNGKIVSPYFFLDISKKTNQYKQITKIVIEKSFQTFENLPYEFSLNVSYEDIENSSFLDFIKDMLSTYNVSNRVVFEILEDEHVKNYDLLINFINEVKNLGCKVAIDDFGSGYSNFEHILKMNIDYLKIDASLIKNISYNNSSYKITKTIIDFAKNLGLKTIAEFVENEEIFNLVKDLGSDYSQGYFFSPPVEKSKINSDSKKIKN